MELNWSRLAAAGAVLATSAAAVLGTPASAFAAGLPDLAIARTGPATAFAGAWFTETLKITNRGTATATGVALNYYPDLAIAPATKGVGCAPIMKGHSVRGGGYTRGGSAE